MIRLVNYVLSAHLIIFPCTVLASGLSYFFEFDHDSLLNEVHDRGHQTIGFGAEYSVGRLSITGKVAHPVFLQEAHRDERDAWGNEDVVGGLTVRYYLGGRK